MIKIENLCKSFKKNILFEIISLTFKDTGLYIIHGENGCGKTTFLNLIGLNDFNYLGHIYYDKVDSKKATKDSRNKYRTDNIAYLMSRSNLISFLSVEENILLGTDAKKEDIQLDSSLIERKDIYGLSGGEDILISLEHIRLLKKKIILLDEVTSSLDDNNCTKVLDKLLELSKTSLIILVTHDKRIINIKNDEIAQIDFNNFKYKD